MNLFRKPQVDPEAQKIADKIKAVFPDPGWPPDRPASEHFDLDGQFINKHFPGKRWIEITDRELGWSGQDSLCFTDEALAYFLPAWLVAFLEEHYPGADNFGRLYLASWVHRLSPLSAYGYSRDQVELVRETLNVVLVDCEPTDEYSQKEFMAMECSPTSYRRGEPWYGIGTAHRGAECS